MTANSPTSAPVALYLDIKQPASIRRQSLLHLWLINLSGEPLGAVRLNMEMAQEGSALQVGGFQGGARLLAPDAALHCPVTVYTERPGQHALNINLSFTASSGQTDVFALRSDLTLEVTDPDATGRTTIEFEGPALIKSPLPPGAVVKFKDAALLNWGEGAEAASAVPGGARQYAPEADQLRALSLVPSLPGVVPIDLRAFAKAWAQSGRFQMATCTFMGTRSATDSAKPGDDYKLRLRSYVGGHVTLLARGTSGRWMCLAPNTHGGTATIPAQADAEFPGALFPLPSDAFPRLRQLPLENPGREQILAFVTRLPLLDPQAFITGSGDDLHIQYLSAGVVTSIMLAALGQPGVEMGYAALQVG